MKIFYYIFSIIIVHSSALVACPTCEGKIKPESPLFFSEEFYKPGNGYAISRAGKEQIGAEEFKKLVESKRGSSKTRPWRSSEGKGENTMKSIITVLFFMISILTSSQSLASPGCMDNSWHLARPFDNKEYHIVGRKVGKTETYCPCPCRKLSLSRGQCLECGHKHEIQPWIIVRTPKLR